SKIPCLSLQYPPTNPVRSKVAHGSFLGDNSDLYRVSFE
ncbi:MAG: hypothetical protein ACI8Q6_000001, partial [Granulosicoccus sp.]